jgi:hypothetical protein
MGGRWDLLISEERAEAVYDLVEEMLVRRPDLARRNLLADMERAVNGDAAAWERLRAACLLEVSEPPKATPDRLLEEAQVTFHAVPDEGPDALTPADAENSSQRRFNIRDLDPDESDRILRLILDLADEVVGGRRVMTSRVIGLRIGAEIGSDDVPDGTIRFWLREARRMRDEGLI